MANSVVKFKNPAGGRPAWEPTQQQRITVERMAAAGIPIDKICMVIGISKHTLRRACRRELDIGMALAVMEVAGFLHLTATGNERYLQVYTDPDTGVETQEIRTRPATNLGPCISAAIFYLKCHGGGAWRASRDNEIPAVAAPILFQGADAKL